MKLCVLNFLTIFVQTVISVNNLRDEFTWTRIDYNWNSYGRNKRDVELEDRYGISHGRPQNHGYRPHFYENYHDGTWNKHGGGNENRRRDNYIYQNNVPIGVAVWKDKMFITVPRRRLGIPSTLNYVTLNRRNKHNVPLNPYPNWEINDLPENYNSSNFESKERKGKIVSVYRVAVDSCDRLWVVDTGKLEAPNATVQIQPAKLILIDLQTDEILREYTFPPSDLRPKTSFTHISAEADKNDCTNAYAYISDILGYGMVVYSLKEDKSWRVTHEFFNADRLKAQLSIAGYTFWWFDGIFSTALGPKKNDGTRDVYFNPMAGFNLYKVSNDVLKNETIATRTKHGDEFIDLGDRGENSQTSVTALHQPTEILFLSLANQNALGCWNINSPLSDLSIVYKNDEKIVYPCDLKVYNDKIYMFTNSMPVFVFGQLDYDKINFRIWTRDVVEAVEGTKCLLHGSKKN